MYTQQDQSRTLGRAIEGSLADLFLDASVRGSVPPLVGPSVRWSVLRILIAEIDKSDKSNIPANLTNLTNLTNISAILI